MNKLLLTLVAILAPASIAPISTYAQSSVYFEAPSTWNTKIGQTLAERRAIWNSPAPGSDRLIADIVNNTSALSFMRNGWSSRHCVATNADPVVTVTPQTGGLEWVLWDELGWNRIHIPNSCTPPTENDAHVVIINSDNPDFLWEFYGATVRARGVSWTARGLWRWARTREAAASTDDNGYDGDGRGLVDIHPGTIAFSSTACPASATISHGTIMKSELDAGEIRHAVRWIFHGENGNPHGKLWPCRVPYTTEGPAPDSRLYAPYMGERLMFDPNINVDTLPIGAHAKIILKALQTYGYIATDTTSEIETAFPLEIADYTGYDFSYSGIPNFNDYVYSNSRVVPCVSAYSGECSGAPSPVTQTQTTPPAAPRNLRVVP